jgi:hypothetical protein
MVWDPSWEHAVASALCRSVPGHNALSTCGRASKRPCPQDTAKQPLPCRPFELPQCNTHQAQLLG